MSDIRKIAERLVTLCREQEFVKAVRELYAEDVEARENCAPPTRGFRDVLRQNEAWVDGHTIHSFDVPDYYVDGNTIILEMIGEFTPKGSERRIHNEQVGVYRVRDGKITNCRFYYSAG